MTAAPRKPPAFTVAVAMPLNRGGFTSRARTHVSVKQLAVSPTRKQSGPRSARGGPRGRHRDAGPDGRVDEREEDVGDATRPEDLVREEARGGRAEDDADADERHDLRGLLRRHPVDVAHPRHRPEAREREQRPVLAEEDEEHRPRAPVAEDGAVPLRDVDSRALGPRGSGGGKPASSGRVADDGEAETREDERERPRRRRTSSASPRPRRRARAARPRGARRGSRRPASGPTTSRTRPAGTTRRPA